MVSLISYIVIHFFNIRGFEGIKNWMSNPRLRGAVPNSRCYFILTITIFSINKKKLNQKKGAEMKGISAIPPHTPHPHPCVCVLLQLAQFWSRYIIHPIILGGWYPTPDGGILITGNRHGLHWHVPPYS